MSPDRRTGFAALGKSALLLVGVPLALVRLVLASAPDRPSAALWLLRAVLAVLTAVWAIAAYRLSADLWRALRGEQLHGGAWSRRWAAACAGLLLAATAGALALRAPAQSGGSGRAGAPTTALTPPVGRHRAPASPLAAEVALIGLGTLGAAALARRLSVLRRLNECLRLPGESPPRPDPASAWEEALLGPLARHEALDLLDTANRLLWRGLRDEASAQPTRPDVALVRADTASVELLLRHAQMPAPPGFIARDGGRRWVLDPALTPEERAALGAGCGRFLPALLPIGDDGDASFLLPLGAGRRLGLSGTAESCQCVLAAFLAALRTLPWADELAVELLGLAPPPFEERCYQLNASSFAELSALAHGDAAVPDRLEATWAPSLLVLLADAPTPAEEDVLAQLAPNAGIVALSGPCTDRLVIDQHGAVLEPLGVSLLPPRPTARQRALVDALLTAAAAGGAPGDPAPIRTLGATAARPTAGTVDVRILGDRPRLDGAIAPTHDEGRVVEVCAYLALSGHEASLEQLRQDVFRRASGTAAPARVAAVCAAARRALGEDANGHLLLPPPIDGTVRLDPAVTLDWTRFAAFAAAALHQPPEEAAAALDEALALIGSPPWVTRGRPSWAWFEAAGHRRTVVAGIIDAAHLRAQLALAAGDPTAARRALHIGRRVEPASEVLARDLLATCDLEGDSEGAQHVYDELEKALERLAGAEPSAPTRALADTLAARRPADATN